MKELLLTKDNNNRIRVINICLDKTETDEGDFYTIRRESGIKDGKMTVQPEIVINKGKVKRTVKEQAELQFNSEIKKYLDKGYKRIQDFGVETLNKLDEKKFLSENVTNQNGVKKPMLCKVFDFNDKKNLGKTWYISKKIDGTRCFLFYKDGEIKTSSRGGQDYDVATTYIRQDPFLVNFFKIHPNYILDGELYKHGWQLSKISGLCRLEEVTEDHKQLEFHCYDIVMEDKTFKERLKFLNDICNDLNENLYWSGVASKLYVVEQILIEPQTSLEELKTKIMTYHNEFVEAGYEGAVVRDADEKYKCGARDRRMQKIKCFTDREDKIIDIVEGLRDEDMCFLMEMSDGKQYKVKPMGTREDKEWYRQNLNTIKGKMGTVKHFGYGANGVPNLPVFRAIRDKKDM